MNLEQMEATVKRIVQDASLENDYKDFINTSILELAEQYDFPTLRALRATPFSVTSDNWIFNLPENFHKNLFRAYDGDYKQIQVLHQGKPLSFDYLDEVNIKHDEVADHVRIAAAAKEGDVDVLGVYPMATETLHLWYYRKPLYLDKPADVCDCIPPGFHDSVIISAAVIKSYEEIQDQIENFDPKALNYWGGRLAEGLFGSPKIGIGLIHYFAKNYRPPRRHGGRDPIGPGRYYYRGG